MGSQGRVACDRPTYSHSYISRRANIKFFMSLVFRACQALRKMAEMDCGVARQFDLSADQVEHDQLFGRLRVRPTGIVD